MTGDSHSTGNKKTKPKKFSNKGQQQGPKGSAPESGVTNNISKDVISLYPPPLKEANNGLVVQRQGSRSSDAVHNCAPRQGPLVSNHHSKCSAGSVSWKPYGRKSSGRSTDTYAPRCKSRKDGVRVENWEAQLEELTALTSIFDEDFCIEGCSGSVEANAARSVEALTRMSRPREGWTLRCKAAVHVVLPNDPLRVLVASDAEPSCSGRTYLEDLMTSHLPPLYVDFQLRQDYPSQGRPHAFLYSCWLTPFQHMLLKRRLFSMWSRQGPGLPILYQWLEWLRNEALLFVKSPLSLQLQPRRIQPGRLSWSFAISHSRAVPSSAEEWRELLQWYNSTCQQQQFAHGLWQCGICLEEVPGLRCMQVVGCRHWYCVACLRQYCKLQVAEGSVDQLHCPTPACGQQFDVQMLRALLSEDEFQRWEDLTLRRSLDSMKDVQYCPRCSTACVEDKDHCCMCPRCFFVFCAVCFQAWHPGSACVSMELRVKMLQQKAAQRKELAGESRRIQEELATLQHIQASAKPCPRCHMATQKVDGCNKMHCSSCGTLWCYRCGKEISGYEHYRQCTLFEEEDIRRWEEQLEEQIERHQQGPVYADHVMAAAEQQRWEHGEQARAMVCPCCAQLNLKAFNNNHLCCWACRAHFCYQCGLRITTRKVSQHYVGPGSCKQHSPD